MVAEQPSSHSTPVFTYGTLKQGFSNHRLILDLISTNDATFIGNYTTIHPLPLVCGPYRVPFLLNLPNHGRLVSGELYTVSERGLAKMDELEGVSRGHYERLPIKVKGDGEVIEAIAYYAHRSYAHELWRRSGEVGYDGYAEKVAVGYVYRKDRPKDLTFLEQIWMFISHSLPSCAEESGETKYNLRNEVKFDQVKYV